MNNTDELLESWASLGVAFNTKSKKQYSPEEAIVFLIKSKEFPEDKKMMGLAITWLCKYSKYVHIERLQNLCKNFSHEELALLGAIASKCYSFNDHRWKKIEKISLKGTRNRNFPHLKDDDFLLKKKGVDPDFLKFNIHVSTLRPDDTKKLLNKEKIFSSNAWLKFRLLFGSNLRADVATVIYLDLFETAYGAAKYLNSSTSAVYRNWQDLKDAKWDAIAMKMEQEERV